MHRPLRVTFVLPALTEATGPFWRPIKYSLFPPLGLATLAAYLAPDDQAVIVDEHVEPLPIDDTPDIAVIQVYITNAYRAYRLADRYRARGVFVALGGLHVTSLPAEAAPHADAIFLGPGEQTFPQFLADFRAGRSARVYQSTSGRTLDRVPPIRRDLIARRRYLVPNSIVVTRGCPQHCDFCYKDAFFTGGRTFYTQRVDDALAEIDRLPGRHLYFLDDHLLGDPRFAADLFSGMRGMNRLFQGAATVDSILRGDLIERAAEAGLRSLFVGFETLTPGNLVQQRQAAEPRARLFGGHGPPAQPRHHDQRQLRLRHGRRRRRRVPADGGLGDRPRHHHRHLPHPDAVSRHRAAGAPRGAGTDHLAQLGSVRHAPCRLPAGAAQPGGAQARLRLGLPRVLPLVVDRPRVVVAWLTEASGEAFLLRRRLEEIRGGLEPGDPGAAARADDAAARSGVVQGPKLA